MPKFNVNDRVRISSGIWKGTAGIITEVLHESAGIQRYNVRTKEKPFGLVLMETALQETGMVPYLESLEVEPRWDWGDKPLDESCDGIVSVGGKYYSEIAVMNGDFNDIKLVVYAGENEKPHFHFYKEHASDGTAPIEYRRKGGCLCFDEAKYYVHGEHTETMTDDEISEMVKFLESTNIHGAKRWKEVIFLWNTNNPEKTQIPYDTPIPHYESGMSSFVEE